MKRLLICILVINIFHGYLLQAGKPAKVLKYNLKIKNNQVYELKNKSKITTKTNRKIIIESSGTLKIQKGAACTLDVKIEIMPGGKMEFEDNTLAWIDEIKLMPSPNPNIKAELVLANNNNNGTNVGCWLLPAEGKTGKIILETGNTLRVFKSKVEENFKVDRVALVGGIEVKEGATFVVENDAKLDLGPFFVRNSGTIEFKKGSQIRLLNKGSFENKADNKNNVCLGTFKTGTGSSQNYTSIDPFNEVTYPYACTPPPDMPYFCKIACGLNKTDWPYVKIQYTDFKNVAVSIKNASYEPVDHCNFVLNTSILSQKPDWKQIKSNTLINIENNWFERFLPVGFNESLILDITISNCKFIDEANINNNMDWLTWARGELPSSDPEYDEYLEFLKKQKEHIGGIFVSGLRNVTIDNSLLFQFDENIQGHEPSFTNLNNKDNHHFWGLNFGVQTVNCSRVNMTGCNMAYTRVGLADQNTSVKPCNNLSFRVNTGNSLNGSKFWGTFDNEFRQSSKAVDMSGTLSGQHFRGNFFNDFYNGIYLQNGKAYLRGTEPDFQLPGTPLIYQMGRNEFEITNPEDYPGLNPERNNVFITPSNLTIYSRSDIFLEKKGIEPKLIIDCGKNQIGEYTPNHLYYKKENPNDPDLVIDCSVNNWRPNATVRQVNIIVTGSNFITGEARIEGCAGETTYEAYCKETIVHPCDFFARNTGIWAMYAPTDTILLNDFNATLNDFCNGMLSCECLKVRLFDLMQLATLCDSSYAKIQMVIDCILDKLEDPLYANCDLPAITLRLGEAYERRGQFENALDQYYYTLYNSQNSSDTTLARWRIMNIEAFQTDTTFGFVYDSLMAEYFARVDRDITKVYVGGGSPPPPPRISAGNEKELDEWNQPLNDITPLGELEQNVPNPFTNETVIKFRLNKEADVRLGIHDNLGQTIKVIIQQRMKPGNYVYTYINEGLGSGVYLYLLTTDGKQYTKKMQLVK